uniref:Uncharacterized protein n=1 Tax=Glossina brevipalpis TaxID=37001 RepID=A0A1A9VZR3_9MUSC
MFAALHQLELEPKMQQESGKLEITITIEFTGCRAYLRQFHFYNKAWWWIVKWLAADCTIGYVLLLCWLAVPITVVLFDYLLTKRYFSAPKIVKDIARRLTHNQKLDLDIDQFNVFISSERYLCTFAEIGIPKIVSSTLPKLRGYE